MDEKEKEALEKARDDEKARADAAESKLKDYEDKAKKDSEETEKQALEAAENDRKDKARKDRHDSEKHDGAHKDCAKCDAAEDRKDESESERMKREAEERAEKDRKDGAPVENVDANVLRELKDAAVRNDATVAELKAQIAALHSQPKIEDANAIAAAFHRADSVFQMHGEATPHAYPGETPRSYKRRLADALRKHSPQFKGHAIHDSIDGPAFDAIEGIIYNDAIEAVKNPATYQHVGLREIKRIGLGNRQISEFVGDSSEWMAPFQHPSVYFLKPNVPQRAGAR